jgi:hypothetical protein
MKNQIQHRTMEFLVWGTLFPLSFACSGAANTTIASTVQRSSSVSPSAAASLARSVELPRNLVSTSFPETSGYIVRTVCASGCNYKTVQAAVNGVHMDGGDLNGEIIKLASGTTFIESVICPEYSMAAGKWVIITTNVSPGGLPAPGVRMHPSSSRALAKITSVTLNTPALQISSRAHHYWFVGLEIAVGPSIRLFQAGVFQIGAAEKRVVDLPHDIVIDRSYIHGNPTGNIRRGVKADGVSVAIINSWISDFQDEGSDTQAIWAYNTPGPIVISNNELQASGENVMFGGNDPDIVNVVPSDITITGNHFDKPLSWFNKSTSYAGIRWAVKNLFEIKNAQRVLVQGNVFEHNWEAAQSGFAMGFSPRNQNGKCPWCTSADITIANNIIRHSSSAIAIVGADTEGGPSLPSQRVNIHDNLFYDINQTNWGGDGRFVQIVNPGAPAHDIFVDHNTVFQTGNILTFDGKPGSTISNFVFTNNIMAHNIYGVVGASQSLNYWAPGAVFTRNAMENIAAGGGGSSYYPTGNFFPNAWTDIRFVDSVNCPSGNIVGNSIGICALAPTSPYIASSTEGRPLGADIKAISAATAGAEP